MIIRRDRYLQRIIARKHNGLVKIITGIRRCGKSFMLFDLFRGHLVSEGVDSGHIIGVDLEDKEYAPLRNPNRLFDYIMERMPQGPGNRGPTECGTTQEATSGMSS